MKSLIKKNIIAIVSFFYFFIMLSLLFKFGININGEATKYLNEANGILKGEFFKNGVFSYFYYSYSIIISFFLKFNLSFTIVGFLQIILSYTAANLLYKLILKKSNCKLTATLTFFIYLFCFPIQYWILFLYSEGVHTSLVVIGFCMFIKLLDLTNWKNILNFLLILLLILTTRPVGILFIISCFATIIYYYLDNNLKKRAYVLIAFTLLGLIAFLNSPYRYFVNPDSLRRMEIICQVPQNGDTLSYAEYNKTGLLGAYKVIKNEIGFKAFFLVGLKKVKSFFGLSRPYFSMRYNLFLSIYLFIYPFAFIGLFIAKEKKMNLIKFTSFTYISVTTVGVFITCNDWSNRFIAPVFPFIITLASLGICWLIKKINIKYFKT